MNKTISTVAILGAGTMGRGIAHVAATGGYNTHLFDVSREVLEKARQTMTRNLEKGVKLGKIDKADADAASARLHLAREIATAVDDADLIIEAVPERMELKVETFKEVSRHCTDDALFASNTSSLSITEMAGATAARQVRRHALLQPRPHHAARRAGARPRDHRGDARGDGEVAARMGKEVVVVREPRASSPRASTP